MVTGYLAAFGFVLFLSVGIFCFGYAARHASLLFVLLLETVLGVLIIFPFLFLQPHFSLSTLFAGLPLANLLWLGAAALFSFAGANYFSLLNLRTAGEKINSLLSPAVTACTIVLSGWVFQERLSLLQWLGAMLTLLSVSYFLLVRAGGNYKTEHFKKQGIWSGFATVICMSLGIICSIKGATGSAAYLHVVWIRLLFALLFVAAGFVLFKEYKYVKRQTAFFYAVVVAGVLAQTIVGGFLWLHASFSIGVAVSQVIIATLPLWVYAADVYLFKKSRPSGLFIIIALLAITGVIMVMQ